MNKENFENYTSVYYRRTDYRKFLGRNAGFNMTSLWDTTDKVSVQIANADLYKDYIADSGNNKRSARKYRHKNSIEVRKPVTSEDIDEFLT